MSLDNGTPIVIKRYKKSCSQNMARASWSIATLTTAGALLACCHSDLTKTIQPPILKRQIHVLHNYMTSYCIHHTQSQYMPKHVFLQELGLAHELWHDMLWLDVHPSRNSNRRRCLAGTQDLTWSRGLKGHHQVMNATIYAHGTYDPCRCTIKEKICRITLQYGVVHLVYIL